MRAIAGVLLVGILVGCGGHGANKASTSSDQDDQAYLRMATQDRQLATEDHGTLITLGREACDLLDQYHGDTAQVDKVFVETGGQGGASFFTPSVLQHLRTAAATAYCPRYA